MHTRMPLLSLAILSAAGILLACQKSSGSGNNPPATGKGTLVVNSTTYQNVTCIQAQDTVSRNPLAVVPSVELLATNGADSVGFFILNLPGQSSWSGAFIDGDSTPVRIDNSNTVTYTGYVLAGFIHVNGSTVVDYSVAAAGGTLTKTAANSFTFTCTTHAPGVKATDLTISGSGSF